MVRPPQPLPRTELPKPSGTSDILREIENAVRNAGKSLEEQVAPTRPASDQAKPAPDEAVSVPEAEDLEPEQREVDLSFLDRLDYNEALEENTDTFDIAGLRYHCSEQDCGVIVGYVKPEPSNPHDPRAQAVIRSDGKLLGYIPRTQLDWYEDFNEDNLECPFVGEIQTDGRGSLVAEIKVIMPVSRSYVEEEIEFELG